MTREILSDMLGSREELDAQGSNFSASDNAELELLLTSTSGGPAVVAKVREVLLGDVFLTVEADKATWCLSYADVMGIRVKPQDREARARTGFHA